MFVTPDKESSMNTLRQEEEFEQIYSRDLLTEKAAEIENPISVKEHERERHDFIKHSRIEIESETNRRPDGIVIHKNHRTLYKNGGKMAEMSPRFVQGLCGQRHELAMNWVDRPRTSADERDVVCSPRCRDCVWAVQGLVVFFFDLLFLREQSI